MAFMREPFYVLMQDGRVEIDHLENRTGIRISQEDFDVIVMMRFHNMSNEERDSATSKALAEQFEIGADGIRKAHGLDTVMQRVKKEIFSREKKDV